MCAFVHACVFVCLHACKRRCMCVCFVHIFVFMCAHSCNVWVCLREYPGVHSTVHLAKLVKVKVVFKCHENPDSQQCKRHTC